jgi:hypothetical protein
MLTEFIMLSVVMLSDFVLLKCSDGTCILFYFCIYIYIFYKKGMTHGQTLAMKTSS